MKATKSNILISWRRVCILTQPNWFVISLNAIIINLISKLLFHSAYLIQLIGQTLQIALTIQLEFPLNPKGQWLSTLSSFF